MSSANRRGRREGDEPREGRDQVENKYFIKNTADAKNDSPMGKVVPVKQVSEISTGAKVELLPGLRSDHFFKIGRTLEKQEEGRSGQVGSVVDPQCPHMLQWVQSDGS